MESKLISEPYLLAGTQTFCHDDSIQRIVQKLRQHRHPNLSQEPPRWWCKTAAVALHHTWPIMQPPQILSIAFKILLLRRDYTISTKISECHGLLFYSYKQNCKFVLCYRRMRGKEHLFFYPTDGRMCVEKKREIKVFIHRKQLCGCKVKRENLFFFPNIKWVCMKWAKYTLEYV